MTSALSALSVAWLLVATGWAAWVLLGPVDNPSRPVDNPVDNSGTRVAYPRPPRGGGTGGSNSRPLLRVRKKDLKAFAGAGARAYARRASDRARRADDLTTVAGLHECRDDEREAKGGTVGTDGEANGKGAGEQRRTDPEVHTEHTLRELLGPIDGGSYPLDCCAGQVTWRNGPEAGLWVCLTVHTNGCEAEEGRKGDVEWYSGAWWTLADVRDHPFGRLRIFDVAPESHHTREREA